MVNELDHVELGLSCADVCQAFYRGLNEKKADELNQSVHDVVDRLTV
jgi:predicted ester cyclase